MIGTIASTILTALIVSLNSAMAVAPVATVQTIATHQFSMNNRYQVPSVNEVMKKNILLSIAYMTGQVSKKSDIDWTKVTSTFHYEKILNPGEVFAFHQNILKQYADKLAFTTNAHFNASDGFVSDGYLFGDGVCDLASLINWAALDAGLKTYVPTDHRAVAHIPDIPDDFGVSIYMNPENGVGTTNNLYVTNTKDKPVTFQFDFDGTNLKVSVTQSA